MDKQQYLSTHPGFDELDVPDYTLHKLRLITPDVRYAPESLDWVSDKEVGKYMGADFSDVSLQGEKDRLMKIIENKDAYNWIIECDKKAIGNININEISETSKEFEVKAGMLNYLIGNKNLWGKGITTALVRIVLDWAFKKANFEVIKSRAVPQNKSSLKVLEKTGFIKYKKEDYDGPNFGEPTEYIAYELMKDAWLKLE
jgi:ribosomal-protein-alanine N-acetyltransferase